MRTTGGKQGLVILVVLLLGIGLAWAAALRICPQCGYEAAPTDTVCQHCGAALPPVEPAPAPPAPEPEPTPAPAPAPPATAPHDMVTAQVQAARDFYRQEAYWPALLFARNAIAMLALEGPKGGPAAAQLALLVQQCRDRLLAVERPCPVCEGTGHAKTQIVTLKGEVIDQEIPGANCPACHGRGTLTGRATLAELQTDYARVLRLYEIEQRRRGLEESQGIWLPYGLADRLTPKETAAVRKAFGVWCPACMGFGSVTCATCGGTGILKCPNSACVQGTEICPECKGAGRTKTSSGGNTLTARCPTCHGVGKITCTTCEGKGYITCTECDGRGAETCSVCKGTGEPPPCRKCAGEGYVVCTHCNGTGTYRDAPCPYCQGKGVTLCTSCMGFGVERKR